MKGQRGGNNPMEMHRYIKNKSWDFLIQNNYIN